MTAVIEVTLAWFLKNMKGRDDKLFVKNEAFADYKEPTIPITSPDCGETGATMTKEYTADGAGTFPILEWKAPDNIAGSVKEWLLVSEDADAPLPTPIAHGVYGGIPPSKTRVEPGDFELADEQTASLKGGFHYGKGFRARIYVPPRPLRGHGVHRYFYEIIALSEPLDKTLLSSKASREAVGEAIKGKVLGWGVWVGSCERKW